MSGTYHVLRGYSPIRDRDEARIVMFDERGSEFFVIVPDEGGSRYRAHRDRALDMIQTAMRQGCAPGEVRMM